MQALGITGWSGSGKTTLITALIPIFLRRGLRVSTIKHAHHQLALDQPGKDSYRHAEAGAQEVILAMASGFALFSRQDQPALEDLLPRLLPVDLVLVEGFKTGNMPKLEVYRPELGQQPLWREIDVLAVAAEAALPGCAVPVLPLGAPERIADFLLKALGLEEIAGAKA